MRSIKKCIITKKDFSSDPSHSTGSSCFKMMMMMMIIEKEEKEQEESQYQCNEGLKLHNS